MSGSARAEIFARLRHASRGASAEHAAAERRSLGRAPAATLPTDDLAEAFLRNVLANRGTINCARSRSEAVKAVGQYLLEHFRSQRLVAGNDPRLAALPWRDAGLLPRFGSLETGEPVALSFAKLGIAETGAVVTLSGRGNPAANVWLGEHHVVLVDTDDLVPDLEQAWDRLNNDMAKDGRPRGINMIAGPSSTADIEGQLVYGAHGPASWHVILLGEITPGAKALGAA